MLTIGPGSSSSSKGESSQSARSRRSPGRWAPDAAGGRGRSRACRAALPPSAGRCGRPARRRAWPAPGRSAPPRRRARRSTCSGARPYARAAFCTGPPERFMKPSGRSSATVVPSSRRTSLSAPPCFSRSGGRRPARSQLGGDDVAERCDACRRSASPDCRARRRAGPWACAAGGTSGGRLLRVRGSAVLAALGLALAALGTRLGGLCSASASASAASSSAVGPLGSATLASIVSGSPM